MKAGLITFHRADNMGAVLQAAALQQYVDANLCPCELIDFVPNDQLHTKKLVYRVKKSLVSLRRLVKKDRAAKFAAFRKKYYRTGSKTYYGDAQLMAAPPKYDILISGSDQIFNTTLSGTSESFYLKPWSNAVKISYASSFGRSALSEAEYRLIRSELPQFQHLSAREDSGAALLEKELGREVPVVCDPVFLLSKAQWAQMAQKNAVAGDYVFAYAMEYSPAMEAAILAWMEKMPVYLLCGSQSAQKLPGNKICDCGPEEFLGWLLGAHTVLTNSFHGTSFSFIFEKPLVCVAHTSRNARLENILKLAGCPGAQVTDPTEDLTCVLDTKAGYAALRPTLERSYAYLKEAMRL